MKSAEKALVVFSGGQDSTTCLGWSLNRFQNVEAVTFHYGQRHAIEIEQAKIICGKLGVSQKIVEVDFFGRLVRSALTSDGDIGAAHEDNPDLPASFVPNRNAFFITLAHAYAQTISAAKLVVGVCQTDYSGYPDCREDFIQAIRRSLNIGSGTDLEILTPLMNLTKAETFGLAEKEGVLGLVVEDSHTCYNGVPDQNLWGRGCGTCPACLLRIKGYEEFRRS